MESTHTPAVAVLVPCHNEATSVARVVQDFSRSLPAARIIVYDNASTDDTATIARNAGADVRLEPAKGKGNVVRRMFADIDADVYVVVDGDATYEARDAPALVDRLLSDHLDMVVARRVGGEDIAYRSGHRLGNRVLTGLVGALFGRHVQDMLSGYRVLSRRFVKSFAAHATGFDTETELTVHALELHMPIAEVPSRYFPRMDGSSSKLNTWRDGFRILGIIIRLVKHGRPLAFFASACGACVVLSVILAIPLFVTYAATGLVPRVPTAVLCAALILLGAVFLVCGLVLDTVSLARRETIYLSYLSYPVPAHNKSLLCPTHPQRAP